MNARTLLVVAPLYAHGALAAESPQVVLSGDTLFLRRLPSVVLEPTIAQHLGTGLTTTFVFTLDAGRIGGRPMKGEAQVRIRYDLWDEKYVIERRDRRPDSPAAATIGRGDLPAWWRSLRLVVVPAAYGLRLPPSRAKVELLVLPFSQAEQRDARDWLLRSFRAPEPPPRVPASAGQPPPPEAATNRAPLREFFGAALAASIGQRSLITYSWTVPVTKE